MAESVDALVSNTSGATHPGSSPGLGTKKGEKFASLLFYLLQLLSDVFRLSGNLVGISINLCKSIQKELFINDTP